MIEFLRQEYLDAGGALVRTLRNGKRRVTKKDVKQRHPFIKDGLADFVRAHPNVLDTYKCGYPSRSTCLAPLDASQASGSRRRHDAGPQAVPGLEATVSTFFLLLSRAKA
jgi:hypothetical protein